MKGLLGRSRCAAGMRSIILIVQFNSAIDDRTHLYTLDLSRQFECRKFK
jgi:hypothetical protein